MKLLAVVISVLALAAASCNAQAPAPAPSLTPAPAPAPLFVNITQLVLNGGQFTTLLKLLQSTSVANELQGAINNSLMQPSAPGITLFAPTDAAFNASSKLLATLNSTLQTQLLRYHCLQTFYPLQVLQQTSDNVTATYATYNGGNGNSYRLNITSKDHGTVTLSTGYNSAVISSTLSDNYPAGVFGISAVLLPPEIFGVPSPAPAPSPESEAPSSSSPSGGSSGPKSSAAEPPNNPAPPSLSAPKLFSFLLLLLSSKFLFL